MDASASKKRILILGGGFGGVATARHLEALLRRRPDVEIVLVSRDNFLLMTSLLFEVFSGALDLRSSRGGIMATTPSGPVPAVGGAAQWTSRLLSAAEGKFGLLLVALVALMGAAPLIPSPVSDAVLTLFTGAVLVASLHAARPGGKPVAVGLALALADFLIGRCTVHFGTRWLVLLQTVLWLSTLIYVIATILGAAFGSREVTEEALLVALCVFLLIGLFGA